jgi:alkylresorcinol/alkylpyrone synthase
MTPRLTTVARAVPPHHADQEQLIAAFRDLWAKEYFNLERIEQLHRAVEVKGRYLALPIEQYLPMKTFEARNDAWIRCAVEIGERVVGDALNRAELTPKEIDAIFFVSVTGVATPSIDARLVNRLGFRSDIKRTPIFGLGCVAGAAGTARVADYLRAYPKQHALLLSVELCSLTLQREDVSIANIISSGLFGDGAAAAVLSGAEVARFGPRIVDTRSIFYADTERVMGWDFVDGGFKVVLSSAVPEMVSKHIRGDVDGFLSAHGLSRGKIAHWVAHTGGPKVLQAFETTLELPADALARSWRSLREVGNLSSASVLHVLSELLESREPKPGEYGLMLAMGPGFCSELVLLQW